MPTRDEHLQQARANRTFAQQIPTAFPNVPVARQWAVIAAFYCALHCIEAHLIRLGRSSSSHVERKNLMRSTQYRVPGTVYFAYIRLENASKGARYRMQQFSAREVEEALNTNLPVIAAFVGLA